MDELMQTLYSYIVEYTYDKYCLRSDYAALREIRDAMGQRLWEQLTERQRGLPEELRRAYDRAQKREPELMFPAAFDLGSALSRRHIP